MRFYEKFRNKSLENYGLCCSDYLSAPAFSWDAILSMMKVKLDLISDVEMYLFFEKGIQGGFSYISKRYSKANKYLKLSDPKKPKKYITYLDKNNLNGYTMSKYPHLAVPWAILRHYWGAIIERPSGAEHVVGFEPGTFQFWLQHLSN